MEQRRKIEAGGGAAKSCTELQRRCQVMPGRQVLCCVMLGRQVLRTIDLPQSSRLDECARGRWRRRRMSGLTRMMLISILKMGQRSEDDGGV